MFTSLLGLVLGFIAQLVNSWLSERRKEDALRDTGARRVESATQKEALDAVRQQKQIEDDLARMSADERRKRLLGWARPGD